MKDLTNYILESINDNKNVEFDSEEILDDKINEDSSQYFANSIEEYFGTMLQSVTDVHKKHLLSGGAKHEILDEFYKDIEDKADAIIEVWMGINDENEIRTFVNNIPSKEYNATEYLKILREFVKAGYDKYTNGESELEGLIDEYLELIDTTLYKLKMWKKQSK